MDIKSSIRYQYTYTLESMQESIGSLKIPFVDIFFEFCKLLQNTDDAEPKKCQKNIRIDEIHMIFLEKP